MSRRIKRFVSNRLNYKFPDEQQSLNWNFTNVSTKITKFPGMPGGFDEYRGGVAPSDTGNITASWKLIGANYAALRPLKDAANAMAGSPEGVLLILPQDQIDESHGIRWAECRTNNVSIPENAADGTTQLDASANFQAANPAWYGCQPTTDTSEPVYNRAGWTHFDDDGTWDTPGVVWGGPRVSSTNLTPGTLLTCTNRGSHVTSPIFRIQIRDTVPDGVQPIIGVRRYAPYTGIEQEGFEWRGEIALNDKLVIDCKTATVTKVPISVLENEENAYSGFTVIRGIGFTELDPGANVLEIYGTFTLIDITIEYPDSWY